MSVRCAHSYADIAVPAGRSTGAARMRELEPTNATRS
jgi:hypothetical protein